MPSRVNPALKKKIANLWRLGELFDHGSGFNDDGSNPDEPHDVNIYVLSTEKLEPILTEDGQFIQP